jgi:hypothetical protein
VSVRKTGLSAASNLVMAFPGSVSVALLWVEAALPMVCLQFADDIPRVYFCGSLVAWKFAIPMVYVQSADDIPDVF